MAKKIVLKDGYEIEDGLITKSGEKNILIEIPGTDILQATIMFSNPEKTETMTFFTGVYKYVFTGYIHINSIGIDTELNQTNIYMDGDDVSIDISYTVPEIYLPEEMRTDGKEVATNDNE